MLKWSPNGRSMFASIIPKGMNGRRNSDSKKCSASSICVVKKLHSSFWISVDFTCVVQMIFWTLTKTCCCWCWDSNAKTDNLVTIKHISVKSEVNSGCSLALPATVNPSKLAHYVENTAGPPLGPISKQRELGHIQVGVTHTWDPSATFNCSCAVPQQRHPESSTRLFLCEGYQPMTGGSSPQRPVMCKAFPCQYAITDELPSIG